MILLPLIHTTLILTTVALALPSSPCPSSPLTLSTYLLPLHINTPTAPYRFGFSIKGVFASSWEPVTFTFRPISTTSPCTGELIQTPTTTTDTSSENEKKLYLHDRQIAPIKGGAWKYLNEGSRFVARVGEISQDPAARGVGAWVVERKDENKGWKVGVRVDLVDGLNLVEGADWTDGMRENGMKEGKVEWGWSVCGVAGVVEDEGPFGEYTYVDGMEVFWGEGGEGEGEGEGDGVRKVGMSCLGGMEIEANA